MAVEAIEIKYNRYLGSIITKITDDASFTEKQENELTEMFNNFGFNNEQIGQVKAASNSAQTQFINQYATMGAIELIKEERAQLLAEAQIRKIESDIVLNVKQAELVDAQILKTTAEIAKINAEKLLVDAQKAQAAAQTALIGSQKALIDRQNQGYDDNLWVKAAEFEGGLASFAVNADSLSAQDAINKFNSTISVLKQRG